MTNLAAAIDKGNVLNLRAGDIILINDERVVLLSVDGLLKIFTVLRLGSIIEPWLIVNYAINQPYEFVGQVKEKF
jgi:hypothetical protein